MFSPDNRPSDEQLLAMLKKADLKSHGYKKEVIEKLVTETGSDKPIDRIAHFYYKIVNCSQVQQIVQELQTLIPGITCRILSLLELISKTIKRKIVLSNPNPVKIEIFGNILFVLHFLGQPLKNGIIMINNSYMVFSGPYAMKVGTKFNREFKARNLSNMKQCKVGLEIHYKVDDGSSSFKRSYIRRQKRNAGCIGICFCCKGEDV